MSRERQLLESLADGAFRSGEALAATLGVSRAAVWKLVRGLAARGLEVHAVRGRGYRLAAPLELLDADAIRAAAGALPGPLELFDTIDSTNTYLLGRAKLGAPTGSACLAETQRAGRGRLGRTWVSPYGASLYLSLLWRFAFAPAQLAGLSLAVGVAAARALEAEGVAGIGLKWPNDVQCDGRKLAGVLLEFGGESSGPCFAVIGVGVNVAMPPGAAIDQPWVDCASIVGRGRVSRNRLAGRLIAELVRGCESFAAGGLEAFSADWQRLDRVAGRPVRLAWLGGAVEGIARGIDRSGALELETAAGVRAFAIGEVSLRLAP